MSDKIARNFLLGLSKTMNTEDFASLVSYFSLTKGKQSEEKVDLRLFPELNSEKETAKLINRVKSELNFVGLSVKKYNQGARILENARRIKDNEIDASLFHYISSINPHEEWGALKDDSLFQLTFSYDDNGCYSKNTTRRNEYGYIVNNQDRYINIDLIYLAKITQALHLELNIPNSRLQETMKSITYTAINHERAHLFQYKLDDALEKMRKLKKQYPEVRINLVDASSFMKFYLSFEYSAWESASEVDREHSRFRALNEAVCNMSLASYLTEWIFEIHFNNKITLPHEETTFTIDEYAENIL